jgi:chemotaxis protein MotB
MRRRKKDVHVSHERWLVSYADFITLLFAFFTTMYAISTVDARKMNAMVGSMQAAFANGEVPAPMRRGGGVGAVGAQALGAAEVSVKPSILPAAASVLPTMSVQAIKTQLESRLSAQVKSGLVDMSVDGRGLVISMREAGSFATGSADLSSIAYEVLREVAATLKDVGNIIRIEGHTDDVPINTVRYRSNFELSTSRATNVIAYLIAQGLEAPRMSAAGYGEFHPRAVNDSVVNRAQNRRVDIVVLSPRVSDREEPSSVP